MNVLVLAGAFLGVSLGANDAANVFGTAVSTRMVRFRVAAGLTAVFVLLGAVLQGDAGVDTLQGISSQTSVTAFLTALSAGIAVTIMTVLRLPISTSQAVVGSIIGVGLHGGRLDVSSLGKVVVCWIATPIGAFVIAVVLYHLLLRGWRFFRPSIVVSDVAQRMGLILAGCYGAYALGANNVANVTAVFAGNTLSTQHALMVGGASIATGAAFFSRGVMSTVGVAIVKLDAFSALVAVLAHAITVHIFALIGVPVSTSQAIVGSVVAIGFIKGVHTVNMRAFVRVAAGWIATPVVGFSIGFFLEMVSRLRLLP